MISLAYAGRPSIAGLLVFAAAYLAAAGYAQLLAFIPNSGISIWPPSGIFVAALLLNRRDSWPYWIATAFLAEIVANAIFFHNNVLVAAAINLGNAGEAVAGAVMVQAVCGRRIRLKSLREVVSLVLLAGALAPVFSASIGSAVLAAAGIQSFWAAWPFFWVGDATGVLVVAPLVFATVVHDHAPVPLSGYRIAEGALVLAALVVASAVGLGGYLPFAYLVLPVLLWAAVRFEFEGAAAGVVIVSLLATLSTVLGFGQFAQIPVDPAERHVLLQLFLATSAVLALVVAAISYQHRRAVDTLRQANEALEARAAERSASLAESERLQSTLLKALPLGVALVDRTGQVLLANAVFSRFVNARVPSRQAETAKLWEGVDETGGRLLPQNFPAARALRGERVWPGQDFLFHGDAERGPFWTRVSSIPFPDAEGQTAGAIVVVEDVDDERRAVDALQLNEKRLRIAHEAAELGSWEYDNITGTPAWSERARELIGAEPDEEPTQEGLLGHIHPEDRKSVRDLIAGVDARGGPNRYHAVYRVVAKDGTVRWLEDHGSIQRDADGNAVRSFGLIRDVTARQVQDQQTALLMREVNHRGKNLLSVVQAIAKQTASKDPVEFIPKFEKRLQALASSQDLLVHSRWKGVSLRDLVESQLAHFADLLGTRITVDGPEVSIGAAAAQALGIAIHELATNAGKYGALSSDAGTVAIGWTLDGDEFRVTWRETGGPAVEPPRKHGFGSLAISRLSELALAAKVVFEFRSEGVSWSLTCDKQNVLQG